MHFASESLDLNSRGGRLSADIQAVVASDFIRNLREETRKGMYGRLKQGLFPFRAPIGYVHSGKGLPKEIDPNKGPLVRKAFELYATGKWSMAKLPDKLNDLGLRGRNGKGLTVNGLHTMLHNPFYTGRMRIEKTGEVFPGIHRPLITDSLFQRVQDIAMGRLAPRTSIHSFTFQKKLRCRRCGNLLVGEAHKRRVYYRCHSRGCTVGYLREDIVVSAVTDELKRLELKGAEYEILRKCASEVVFDWREEAERIQKEVSEQQAELANRKKRLLDSYLDAVIDKEDLDVESFAEPALEYYPIKKIHDLPKPVLISRFVTDYNFL